MGERRRVFPEDFVVRTGPRGCWWTKLLKRERSEEVFGCLSAELELKMGPKVWAKAFDQETVCRKPSIDEDAEMFRSNLSHVPRNNRT